MATDFQQFSQNAIDLAQTRTRTDWALGDLLLKTPLSYQEWDELASHLGTPRATLERKAFIASLFTPNTRSPELPFGVYAQVSRIPDPAIRSECLEGFNGNDDDMRQAVNQYLEEMHSEGRHSVGMPVGDGIRVQASRSEDHLEITIRTEDTELSGQTTSVVSPSQQRIHFDLVPRTGARSGASV